MKLLIDECLSPELTRLAHAEGYEESSHVVWLGRSGLKDWELKPADLPRTLAQRASTPTWRSMPG